MGEIQDLMRQFDHGNGEWKQFLKSIKINNIHRWENQELIFKFPVVAIVWRKWDRKKYIFKSGSLCL